MTARDTILVTAPSSGGKSTYVGALQRLFAGCELYHVTDTTSIVYGAQQDHALDFGRHHVHPPEFAQAYGIVPNSEGGHDHTSFPIGDSIFPFPFMVTDNFIRDEMMTHFWQTIAEQPRGGIVLAELALGGNGHAPNSEHFHADFSATSLVRNFGTVYPADGLSRLACVIHPVTDYGLRVERANVGRPDINETVAKIFERDDIHELSAFLKKTYAVPTIEINNNKPLPPGDQEFRESLLMQYLARQLTPYFRRETGFAPLRER